MREGRGVKPTAMADALMPAVRDALDRLRAGLEQRSTFEPSRSTRVFNISAPRCRRLHPRAPKWPGGSRAEAPGIRISWSQVQRGPHFNRARIRQAGSRHRRRRPARAGHGKRRIARHALCVRHVPRPSRRRKGPDNGRLRGAAPRRRLSSRREGRSLCRGNRTRSRSPDHARHAPAPPYARAGDRAPDAPGRHRAAASGRELRPCGPAASALSFRTCAACSTGAAKMPKTPPSPGCATLSSNWPKQAEAA